MYEPLALLAGFALLYSLVARGIGRTIISGPMVFLAFGFVIGPMALGWLPLEPDAEVLKGLAELTLALMLFTDAAGADLGVVKKTRKLPVRLLLIGLPLTILLGFAAGSVLFSYMTLLEVAILATMLAPTDAALGKGVVTNPAVPDGVRQSLNIESGLNDGICVPILYLFLGLAAGQVTGKSPAAVGLHLLVEEIGVGVLTGVVLTGLAVVVLRTARVRDWLSPTWTQVSVIALAFTCFSVAQLLGGSGFIASFSGGLLFGALLKPHREELLSNGEGIGDTFSLLTWVVFGAAVVGRAVGHFEWTMVLYAALSLTVVRMLPVFIAVLGLGIPTEGKLFLGWFGPRGLASIVFLVIVVGEDLPHADELILVVVLTITLSIIMHGVTANPWARGFGARMKQRQPPPTGDR